MSFTNIFFLFCSDEQNMRYLLKVLEPLSSRIQQIKDSKSADDNCDKQQESLQTEEKDEQANAPRVTSPEANGNPGHKEPANIDKEGLEKHSPKEKDGKTTSDTDDKYLLLLFEIIQGLLQDMVCYLHSIMPEQVRRYLGYRYVRHL